MYIKQTYNNNIVLVTLENGQEAIIIGTGIGFSKQPGEAIDRNKIKKIYYPQSNATKNLNDHVLARALPASLLFVEAALEQVEQELQMTVSSSLFISLLEHMNNIAIEGSYLEAEHPLRWIVKRVYPEIYEVAKKIYEKSCQQFEQKIPRSEIVAISLHIINGVQKTSMPETFETTKLLNEILRILEYSGVFKLEKQSIDYSRFMTHLEFLFNRLRSENKYVGGRYEVINEIAYDMMFTNIQESAKIKEVLEKLLAIIQNKYGAVSESEKLFLLVHLVKLSSY